ncbi:hypothetical protein GJ744_010890 [Endocarpon pusillum]|uniref:VASt domain-containing protein n=1 Tax=Endocarpon pusillum TaxID=364733 RepID=A0A8H7E3W9_9EURO|nr:hypothetical protein GJ744_010890 [Endocarpon pusillum]
MEAVSQAPMPSPVASPRGFKKVLSNRSRTSIQEPGSDTSSTHGLRKSADSTRDHSPKDLSRNSSRDDSSKSGSSGFRKLIPGHAKRKRRRMREAGGLLQPEGDATDNNNKLTIKTANAPAPISRNHSSTSLPPDDNSSLLTEDESEPASACPPLLTHDSHAGYLTHSSPLINTTAVDDTISTSQTESQPAQSSEEPLQSPSLGASGAPSITHSPSLPATSSTSALNSPTLFDRANTLGPPTEPGSARRKSIGTSIRGISPGRKLKEAFQPGKSTRGPRTSPDRGSLRGTRSDLQITDATTNETGPTARTKAPAPPPILVGGKTDSSNQPSISGAVISPLNPKARPQTPPSAASTAPLTTVTPPTPVDSRAPTPRSPVRNSESPTRSNDASGIKASPSGNMISHRRVHSESGSLHQPSKLSNAISAPLTPTIEEAKTPSARSESRNVTQGSGFFSSWVSAAQNAANTITNTLNTQTRGRSETEDGEPEKPITTERRSDLIGKLGGEPGSPKKQLAVETLGAGDLKLSHLGIGTESKDNGSTRPHLIDAPKDSTIQRDEAAAKVEDMLAKRAVSAAYEKPSEDSSKTPFAELSEPMNNMKHTSTFNSTVSGELQTTPDGSILDGETGSVRRNNSVRSRLKGRRKRGSSTATGISSVGTLLAASASSLANPAAGPKLTGFAVAPKARNRTFHQLFRSVPEDDFLIEDYSCALQKEILLAGRIYISEGHICFSSNILGWVTTLVISFEEVMAIERETTAMVFPNAIAIQTLHARHTFRSLLSREATFDLMVGIWKASHPAAFKKSINGKQAEEETAQKTDKLAEIESESEEESEDEDEMYDEDEEEEGAGSFVEARSIAGSDITDAAQAAIRKASAISGAAASAVVAQSGAAGDGQAAEKALAAASASTVDFPGPTTHAPTDCTDSATHYDKVLKDETIPAPLGKIYSMLFGPSSGIFLTKYLVDEQKVTELQYDDDKKGLGEQNKTRSYSYIKPLYGSIGPKQTKCTTSENLDAFDLERSVSVTCTTQTPDVPSGNVFSVKTRYCLSWAAGNATRLQMNCTIEWTGKSWLKGPIEKGATDGQQTYGNDLVKALRSAVSARPRAATAGSKGLKSGKRRRKGEKSSSALPQSQVVKPEEESWGLLEPFRGIFGPIVSIFKPFAGTMAVVIIVILLCIIWFRRPVRGPAGGIGYPNYPSAARLAAYEEMWQREESELWSWLEDRVGIEGLGLNDHAKQKGKKASALTARAKAKERQKVLAGKDVEARLREERMTEREVEDAIRVTQARLDVLKGVMAEKKSARQGSRAEGKGSE